MIIHNQIAVALLRIVVFPGTWVELF